MTSIPVKHHHRTYMHADSYRLNAWLLINNSDILTSSQGCQRRVFFICTLSTKSVVLKSIICSDIHILFRIIFPNILSVTAITV